MLSWRNLFKSKKFSTFRRHASLHDCMFKLILHAEVKAGVYTDNFWGHFNAHGFTNPSESWTQLWSNNVHNHFCFSYPKNCFKYVICCQNLLESAPISSCFCGYCRKKNVFTRKVWGLCTPWFSILRPPKHWFEYGDHFGTKLKWRLGIGKKGFLRFGW